MSQSMIGSKAMIENDVKDFKQTMFALNIQWSLNGVCWFYAGITSAWINGYE